MSSRDPRYEDPNTVHPLGSARNAIVINDHNVPVITDTTPNPVNQDAPAPPAAFTTYHQYATDRRDRELDLVSPDEYEDEEPPSISSLRNSYRASDPDGLIRLRDIARRCISHGDTLASTSITVGRVTDSAGNRLYVRACWSASVAFLAVDAAGEFVRDPPLNQRLWIRDFDPDPLFWDMIYCLWFAVDFWYLGLTQNTIRAESSVRNGFRRLIFECYMLRHGGCELTVARLGDVLT